MNGRQLKKGKTPAGVVIDGLYPTGILKIVQAAAPAPVAG